MNTNLLFLILIIFKSSWLNAPNRVNMFIIRNIGQGQWISHITTSECHHYDFGGEKTFYRKVSPTVINHCSNKINRLYLSHFDYDHYSFYDLIIKKLNHVCWAYKAKNAHFNIHVPYCHALDHSSLLYYNFSHKNKNSSSAVFLKNNILVPGDSPLSEEKKWLSLIKKPVSILILGHHGSKTSTSDQLLDRLVDLKMAIVSSRHKKYGHPHRNIIHKLKKYTVPLLKTEDWGSIYLHVI